MPGYKIRRLSGENSSLRVGSQEAKYLWMGKYFARASGIKLFGPSLGRSSGILQPGILQLLQLLTPEFLFPTTLLQPPDY